MGSANSSIFSSEGGNETQSFSREAVGRTLHVYGSPLWSSNELETWAGNAPPAIEAALVKTLTNSEMPANSSTISVSPGPVSVTSDFARARFNIHAQVVPFKVANDPDGSMYRERFQSFYRVIENIDDSAQ